MNIEGKEKLKTGAAYIRVSTEEQLEFSPDSQLKKIREYARGHQIILPEEFIFVDEGISGRSAKKRPSFMRMIGNAKCKPRPFEVILLWKFSRFARNRQDSILYKSMLRKECGIDVVSITEQLTDDPTAILIEALLEAMDEYYSINLAQEVRRGMNEKFSRGGVVSIPPFGYQMGEGHFEPDKEAAPFVRMIYGEFLNGISCRQIAGKLNRLGVRSRRGNLFEDRTVEYILSNPVYAGKLRRNIDGKDMVVVTGGHMPLVAEEIFQSVQERLEEVKRAHPKSTVTSKAGLMLRGLVRCSCCGSTLTGTSGGKALQCHRYARGTCEKSHYISLKKLNVTVVDQIEADIGEEQVLIRRGQRKYLDTEKTISILLEREYQRLERIKSAYEAGVDSLEEYRTRKDVCTRQITSLKKEEENIISQEKQLPDEIYLSMKQITGLLKSKEFPENIKNDVLRSFITKIVFFREEGAIQIYYHT